MKVYLSGPLIGQTDSVRGNWRETAKWHLGAENCVDPLRRDYRGVERENYREIVVLDKLDIDGCDVLLVSAQPPSAGTAMEVFYAWEAGIPVVVFSAQEEPLSAWMIYHSTVVVENLSEAIAWISRHIAGFGE